MLRLFDTLLVRLGVDKLEWISRDYFGVQLFAMGIIENLLQPLVGADAKMIVAVNANLKVFLQLALVKVLFASLAPDENILSAYHAILFLDRLDLAFLFTKPGHN
jgi:hypothetical protein